MEWIIKKDFPIYKTYPNLIYFDSAATTLKPQVVVDAVVHYYTHIGANVQRGDYRLSMHATRAYDAVRMKVAQFINGDTKGVVFTSGASESLNLIALSLGAEVLKPGDVVLLNEAEHASNVLPWFSIAKKAGAHVEFIPFDDEGNLTLDSIKSSLHARVKIVSIAHVSNVLGKVNDIKAISKLVHENGSYLVVDGAQAVGHSSVDVKDMGVDFYAFSAHKMMGPSGVGIMYGRPEILKRLQPIYMGGGSNARFNVCGDIELKDIPYRFESGTPNIEGVLGFGAAIDYIEAIGVEVIRDHEALLHKIVIDGLRKMDHIKLYNPKANTGIVLFNVVDIFSQDVAAYLDTFGIAVRSGAHCSKLAGDVIKTENTLRLSLHIYNSVEDVEKFLRVINEITLEKTIDTYL